MSDQTPAPPADVGALLEALRAEVRARRLSQPAPPAGPLERELQRSLDEIELHRVVSAHWPLTGQTLPQKAVALVNKLVRRGLRWYINPIVEQQNAYNDAVARALRLLADAYTELAGQIDTGQRPTTNDQRPTASPGDEGRGTEGEEPGADRRPWARPDDEGQRTEGEGRESEGSLQPVSGAAQAEPGARQAALMELVRTRGAQEPPARFPDLELRALEPQLRLRQEVSAHWPLEERTPAERAAALVHKLTRRYLRWYINPIVEQQNAANAALTQALQALFALDSERRAHIAKLRSTSPCQREG
jgi:predicted nucleic acid-binding protein